MALTSSYSNNLNDTLFPNFSLTSILGNIIFGETSRSKNIQFYNDLIPVPNEVNDPISGLPIKNIYIFSTIANSFQIFNNNTSIANFITQQDVTNKNRIKFKILKLNFNYPLRITADTSVGTYTIPACAINCSCYAENNLHTDYKGTFSESIPNYPLKFLSGPYTPNTTLDYGAPYTLKVNDFPHFNNKIGTSLRQNSFEIMSGQTINSVNINGIPCTEVEKPYNAPEEITLYYHQPWAWNTIVLFILVGIWVIVQISVSSGIANHKTIKSHIQETIKHFPTELQKTKDNFPEDLNFIKKND